MQKPVMFILCWAMFLPVMVVNAQQHLQSTLKAPTPNEYFLQVKQLGEFFDRFNYRSDWNGNSIDSSFAAAYPRRTYLTYLLNSTDKRLGQTTDSTYIKLCNAFFNNAVNSQDPLTISLYSGQVVAKAKVAAKYRGKPETLTVYFKPEVLSDRSAKWVISKVETQCFKTMDDSLKTYFIAPNSHETGFINLKRIEQLSNPLYFMPASVAADTTLMFMTEVAAGRITIDYTKQVVYLISFPKWQITVEEFVRSNYNSGWLISNVERLQAE